MRNKETKVAAWQNRLLGTFRGPTGISGDKLLELNQIECDHAVQLYRNAGGYATLMDAFLDFYVHTHQETCNHNPRPSAFAIALFLATLWRFRTSMIIFWKGYYYDASAHLRAIFENIFYVGAVRKGEVKELMMFEIPGIDDPTLSKTKKKRLIATHQRRTSDLVRTKMIGAESGLSEEDQDTLQSVIGFLHSHVHRAESNLMSLYVDLARGKPIRIVPEVDVEKASQFMNMSVLAGWSLTRLLPHLSNPELFSDNWRVRYEVLDESFAYYVAEFDKPLGRAFERFLASNLPAPLTKD